MKCLEVRANERPREKNALGGDTYIDTLTSQLLDQSGPRAKLVKIRIFQVVLVKANSGKARSPAPPLLFFFGFFRVITKMPPNCIFS